MSAKLWRLRAGSTGSGPTCVPHWQLGELAAQVRSASAQELSHLATCAACDEAYRGLRAAFSESRHEALPPHVRAALCVAHGRGRWAARSWTWTLLLPSLASFIWLLAAAPAFSTPPPGPPHTASLVATVQRARQVTQSRVPLERLSALEAGDQISLDVTDANEQWVILEGWEDPRWEIYYAGRVPPGGRLPVAVDVPDAGEIRLRLWACPKAPMPADKNAGCAARLYSF